MLEGSIQRQADRVRVTAQLIDATSGAHVWSERWDRPAQDVFAVQTEVCERVASALGGDNLLLSQGRAAAKRKRPADLQAYDLLALADEALLGDTEADLDRALQLTDQAIARDPGMARAYVKKAWVLNSLKKFRKNYKETFAAMEGLARTAIAADPYEAEAYAVLAFATNSLARPAEALAAARQAVGLNPSSADILDRLAETMVDLGYPEDGAAQCDRAFRLNPSPPDWYGAFCHAAYFHTGRYRTRWPRSTAGAPAASSPSPCSPTAPPTSPSSGREPGGGRDGGGDAAALPRGVARVARQRALDLPARAGRAADRGLGDQGRRAGLRDRRGAARLPDAAPAARLRRPAPRGLITYVAGTSRQHRTA